MIPATPPQPPPAVVAVVGELAALVRGAVGDDGFVVIACADPAAAVAAVHGRLPALAVVGGASPASPWLDALARGEPGCWRVLLVGADEAALAVAAIERGDADAVLVGPWSPAQVAAALRQGVGEARRRRDANARLTGLGVRVGELERGLADRVRALEHVRRELERREREVVRLETQGSLARLARGLAHEINNPLAAILGFAQRLQRRLADDADAVGRLEVIVTEVDRCRQLVERLRGLAQPLDEEILHCQPDQAFELARERLRAAGREPPPCEVDRPLPEVLGGARSLSRVFEIALDNAREAGARHCWLRAKRDGARVRLELINDGRTPSEDELRHAGRPFYSGLPGRRGLGLATAAALLREQDGAVTLTAREDAPGAATVVWLPAPPTNAEPVTPVVGTAVGERRVLVVDDEPLVAELLHDCFADAGWASTDVATVADATELLADRAIRAIIADVHLPDGSGVDLLRRALALRPDLAGHVALVTGDDRPEHIAQLGVECGALTLTKPFRLEQVQALIRAIL